MHKHISIRHHFICQTMADKQIIMLYCPTKDVTTNILTKVLPMYKTTTHLQNIRIVHHPGLWVVGHKQNTY